MSLWFVVYIQRVNPGGGPWCIRRRRRVSAKLGERNVVGEIEQGLGVVRIAFQIEG